MKTPKIIALAAALSLTVTTFPLLVRGDETLYDSESDPLVSLSYITDVLTPAYDEKLAEMDAALDKMNKTIDALNEALADARAESAALSAKLSDASAKNAALEQQLTAASGKIDALSAELAALAEQPSGSYQVICLAKGAKLLAESPCEIILRSGTAIAVSITTNGINDISDGTELMNAVDVPLYHCLLVPRGGDGRGIQVTSAEAYIMVRGEYQIVN